MRSLRFQIIIPFLLGSLILTVFLSYYTHTSVRKAVDESVLLIARAQTIAVHNSMSLFFRSMSTFVEKMTTDPHVTNLFIEEAQLREKFAEEADSWFETLIQGNEYYRGIMVVNSQGTCIASNSQMQVGVSYAGRPYIQAALAGEFSLCDVNVGVMTKNLSATAAAPIYIDGKIVGAVAMTNDFPQIVKYSQTEWEGIQSVFTAFLTPGGKFVSHRDAKRMEAGANFSRLYDRLADMRDGGRVEYELDEERYVGYAMLEPTTRWVVISSGVDSQVFHYAKTLSTVVFLVSLAALCLTSFVVVRVVNGVISSLLSLISYAKKVSEGNLPSEPRDSSRVNELGILHSALRTLVSSMRKMVVESQEASKMKSEFLANMSHEIRTPLNAVIGMTHLYLVGAGDPQKKRDYIVKIQVAAKALLGIINNILDISKIEAGMFELDHVPFNLREAVEQVAVIHQENALAKGIELAVSYDKELPELFIGDPVRFGQVLNNLAGNALKFTDRGVVRIRCGFAEQARAGEPLCLRVSVSDTGLGIPEQKLHTLFKPFSQADASITRRFGGTGLGLAISNKIVAMMGGEFSVQSVDGRGTTFSFTLRLEPDRNALNEGPEGTPPADMRQVSLENKRILVAEDNAINQLLMEELLRPTGAEIVMADNGLQAVDAVKAQRFDLVLMDMQMPVMDGIQASREIRAIAGCKDLPIVAVTANAMKEDKEQGFAAGLNDYITKPIEPQQFALLIRRWIR